VQENLIFHRIDSSGDAFRHADLLCGLLSNRCDFAPVMRLVIPKYHVIRYCTRTMDLNMQPETYRTSESHRPGSAPPRLQGPSPCRESFFGFYQKEQRLQKFITGGGERMRLFTKAAKEIMKWL